MKKGKKLTA